MLVQLRNYLEKRKYEVLLVALAVHLYAGAFFSDFEIYSRIVWPINMIILAVACIGIFSRKGRTKNLIKNILIALVLLFPVVFPFLQFNEVFFSLLSITYSLFFIFIFVEIIKFLIKPGYINIDIISASACVFLLLIEISTFMLLLGLYTETMVFHGLDLVNSPGIFVDLVYFSTITITSIGFGDISPENHTARLIVAVIGMGAQFYSVVLIGILIGKFTANFRDEKRFDE